MSKRKPVLAWKSTVIFYVVLLGIILALDAANQIAEPRYIALQILLVSLGLGFFVFINWYYNEDLSAHRGVLLAFSVGIFTIIPGVLMGLNPPAEFWEAYFNIGLGMAASSFLGFIFIEFSNRRSGS